MLRSGGTLEADARNAGVTLYAGGGGSVYSPLHVLRLARFLSSRQFDIIHVHLYPAQLWVCLARSLSGSNTPIVTTEHSTSNRRRTAFFRTLDRWMYRQFAAIAAISGATRDALLAHIGNGMPTIRVVPNGVDASRFESGRPSECEPKARALVILSTGSLTRVKDQATLIRAIVQIEGAKLVLAGDGPMRGELEALASSLGVRSHVEFLGIRRDIPQLIAKADLYVQASLWEGFCLAVVEAMCGGLPCIASRNSGLQEIVGPAGMYYEPGNADDLASAIRNLSGDPAKRAEMSAKSLDRASMFTLQACCAAYEDFYRDAIQRVSRGAGSVS
jgi:glycosyltransferase involved in cell wall biosynthesis